MNFDHGRVLHARDAEVAVGRLLRGAVPESDATFQRGGNSPDDSAFGLLLDADGIDDEAAIDRRNHPLDFDVAAFIDVDVDDISDVRAAIIHVAGDSTAARPDHGFAPARFLAHDFEHTAQTTPIVGLTSNSERVGPLQKFEAKREWISTALVREFVDERFARKNTRRREDRTPRPVLHRQIDRNIRGFDRGNVVRNIVNAPGPAPIPAFVAFGFRLERGEVVKRAGLGVFPGNDFA